MNKKSALKGALAVQTPVFQESTINIKIKSSSPDRKHELIHLQAGKLLLTMVQNPKVTRSNLIYSIALPVFCMAENSTRKEKEKQLSGGKCVINFTEKGQISLIHEFLLIKNMSPNSMEKEEQAVYVRRNKNGPKSYGRKRNEQNKKSAH